MMVSNGETLLSASAVKLYGRLIKGLTIDLADARSELGANGFLRSQLDPAKNADAPPSLARIYGFSHGGRYTPLSRPAIFLVHGGGGDADLGTTPMASGGSGVTARGLEIPTDIKVWEYDRGDFSLRLDIDSGPLERILIEAEEGRDDVPAYFRGAKTRLRGPGE
jgi:hypothetical protein